MTRTRLAPSLVDAEGRASSNLRFLRFSGMRPPVLRRLCWLSREMPLRAPGLEAESHWGRAMRGSLNRQKNTLLQREKAALSSKKRALSC